MNLKADHINRRTRVVTRYIGSRIKGLENAGIRDHNARDRDQQCFSRDQEIFAGSGIKILGTNLVSVTKSIPRYDPDELNCN